MKNLTHYLVHLLGKGRNWDQAYLSPSRDRCLVCDYELGEDPLYKRYRICPQCRFHYSLTARERIELLADERSFKETNRNLVSLDPLSFSNGRAYKSSLSRDQKRTGLTEAAVTGRCKIGGHKVIILVLDFGFLGGSMGSVVGEKVALAFEMARKKNRPLVAVISGGGARLQEGVLSLMQMAKTVTAANQLRERRIPFIAVMANPTTGQAYASFANLADVIIAEPGALMGLAPMRILKNLSEAPLPLDAHTAESHLKHGLIDMVADREELKEYIEKLLTVLHYENNGAISKKQAKKIKLDSPGEPEASEAVALVRHHQRPTSSYYIRKLIDSFVELHGDRMSGDDRSLIGGLGMLRGQRVMVIAQERQGSNGSHNGHSNYIFPEGFRKAQRLMALAARFELPVITFIDTSGAYPGLEAEEQGIGNIIANTLSMMMELPVPVVSVIVGEGTGEGALALSVADRILMQENALYSPVSLERAAELLSRDSTKVQEAVETLRLTSQDCQDLGIVDIVVPEAEGGAHVNPDETAEYLRLALVRELGFLLRRRTNKLVKERQNKFRKMGEYSTYFKEAVRQEVDLLQAIAQQKSQRKRKAKEKQPA